MKSIAPLTLVAGTTVRKASVARGGGEGNDPVYCAIERHKAAAAIWDAAVNERGNFPARGERSDEEREQIWLLDEAVDQLYRPMTAAGLDFLKTKPKTVPGCIAAIQYARAQMLNDAVYMPLDLKYEGDGDAVQTKAWLDAFLATLVAAIADLGCGLAVPS